MKATEAKLLSLLQKSPQFIIPIYQRTYSWTEKQCRQLWNDTLRAGASNAITVHFIGSIVYVEQGLSQVSHQSPLLVIDGQQRLTSLAAVVRGKPVTVRRRRKPIELLFNLEHPEELALVTEVDEDNDQDGDDDLELESDETDSTEDELQKRLLGVEVLEQRIAELEIRVAELENRVG